MPLLDKTSVRKQRSEEQSLFLEAVIDSAPDEGEEVWVTIPSLDNSRHRRGPCPWQPRVLDGVNVNPSVGDRALVVQSEDSTYWVVCWWPY